MSDRSPQHEIEHEIEVLDALDLLLSCSRVRESPARAELESYRDDIREGFAADEAAAGALSSLALPNGMRGHVFSYDRRVIGRCLRAAQKALADAATADPEETQR